MVDRVVIDSAIFSIAFAACCCTYPFERCLAISSLPEQPFDCLVVAEDPSPFVSGSLEDVAPV